MRICFFILSPKDKASGLWSWFCSPAALSTSWLHKHSDLHLNQSTRGRASALCSERESLGLTGTWCTSEVTLHTERKINHKNMKDVYIHMYIPEFILCTHKDTHTYTHPEFSRTMWRKQSWEIHCMIPRSVLRRHWCVLRHYPVAEFPLFHSLDWRTRPPSPGNFQICFHATHFLTGVS